MVRLIIWWEWWDVWKVWKFKKLSLLSLKLNLYRENFSKIVKVLINLRTFRGLWVTRFYSCLVVVVSYNLSFEKVSRSSLQFCFFRWIRQNAVSPVRWNCWSLSRTTFVCIQRCEYCNNNLQSVKFITNFQKIKWIFNFQIRKRSHCSLWSRMGWAM